nr:hypothetical protein BaRGS_033646 [Batillaria attramentaria]
MAMDTWIGAVFAYFGKGGLVLCCATIALSVFLWNVQKQRVRKDQTLCAAVRHYLCVKALYVLGYVLRRRLTSATCNVAEVQRSFLLKQLQSNCNTDYGKKYEFASMRSVEEYTDQHPLTRYVHYAPYVERMLKGEKNVLTKEEPVVFGVSSGTSGEGCKTIPTSKHQRLQFFLHAVSVLYCCLLDAYPQVATRLRKSMKIFYNPSKWRTSKGGVKVGPNSSTPSSMKGLLHMYSTPAPGFEVVTEPEALYVHLLFALKDRELGMIEGNFASIVYNALKTLQKELPDLLRDITQGTLNPALDIPKDVRVQLEALLKPDPDRANEIREAFVEGVAGVCGRIWPQLSAVLTADSGTFAPYSDKLRTTFLKGVPLYSPVYAATEGLVGINLWPDQLPSRYLLHPSVHFFEFIPEELCADEQPRTLLMHQV